MHKLFRASFWKKFGAYRRLLKGIGKASKCLYKKPYQAIEHLETALKWKEIILSIGTTTEDIAEAYYLQSKAWYQLFELEKAMIAIDKALELHPSYGNAHHHKACIYHMQQEFDKALESAQKALMLAPSHPLSLLIANITASTGKHPQAIKAYTHLIKESKEKDLSWAYFKRAISYYQLKKFEQAFTDYQLAYTDKKGFFYKSLTYFHHLKGEKFFKKMVDFKELTSRSSQLRFEKTITLIQQRPQLVALLCKANHAVQQKHFDDATKYFNNMFEIDKQMGRIYLLLGALALEQNEIKLAKNHINRAKNLGIEDERISKRLPQQSLLQELAEKHTDIFAK